MASKENGRRAPDGALGALSKPRGPKGLRRDPLARENEELRQENARLKRRLKQAETDQYEKDKGGDPPTKDTWGKEGRDKEAEDTKAWTGSAHKDLDAETNHGKKPRTSTPSAITQRSKPK